MINPIKRWRRWRLRRKIRRIAKDRNYWRSLATGGKDV